MKIRSKLAILLCLSMGAGWCEIIENGGVPSAPPRLVGGKEPPTPPPPDDPTPPPPPEPAPFPSPNANCEVIHCPDGYHCVETNGVGQCVRGEKR